MVWISVPVFTIIAITCGAAFKIQNITREVRVGQKGFSLQCEKTTSRYDRRLLAEKSRKRKNLRTCQQGTMRRGRVCVESLDGGWYRKFRFGEIVKGKSDGVYTCTETYQGYDHTRVVYKKTVWNVIVIGPHTSGSSSTKTVMTKMPGRNVTLNGNSTSPTKTVTTKIPSRDVTLIDDSTSSPTKTVTISPTSRHTEKSSELLQSSTATHKPSERFNKHSTTLSTTHLDIQTANSINSRTIAAVTFLSAVASFVFVAFVVMIVKRQCVKTENSENNSMKSLSKCPWPL
ncbi:uncharacterized protein LOC134188150 isoform X1 [Corticium candelabrum]|uniref:uncharacterized protein LOC134188150 isoform X1 n=1 Tax=Corticium candelabrum TaxID=121492 RepID=UPI002E25E99F|nr:uncharacterized protein LOC134188150 isoform X1 [Corticium candelabrum]